MTKEILVHRLTTMHNLWFIQDLMRKIRVAVQEGTLSALYEHAKRLNQLAED